MSEIVLCWRIRAPRVGDRILGRTVQAVHRTGRGRYELELAGGRRSVVRIERPEREPQHDVPILEDPYA